MPNTASPWLTLFSIVTVVLTHVSGKLHDVRTSLHALQRRLDDLAKHPRATDVARIAEALGTARRTVMGRANQLEGVPKIFFSRLTDPPPPAEVRAVEGVLEDIRAELQAVRLEDLGDALKGLDELRAHEQLAIHTEALGGVVPNTAALVLLAEVARDVAHASRELDEQADRLAAERDRLQGTEMANAAAAVLEGNEALAAAEVVSKASPAPATSAEAVA